MKSNLVLSPYGMRNSIAACEGEEDAEPYYRYDTRFKSGLVVTNKVYLSEVAEKGYQHKSGFQVDVIPKGHDMRSHVLQDVRDRTGGRLPNIISVCSDDCVYVNIVDLELEDDSHKAKVQNLVGGGHLYRKGFGRFALYVLDTPQPNESLYHDFASANCIDLPSFSVIASIEAKGSNRGQATNFIFDSQGVTAVSATYYGIHVQHTTLHNHQKEGKLCHFALIDDMASKVLFKGRIYL